MLQLSLPGFPEGAIRIGSTVSVLERSGRVTYFVGMDNYFSHAKGDAAGRQMALATLVLNKHVRAVEVASSPLGVPYRTLMRWQAQLVEEGPGSFYAPRRTRGGSVMTPEKIAECGRLLQAGNSRAQVSQLAGVKVSTLAKAIRAGHVKEVPEAAEDGGPQGQADAHGTSKSARSRMDAQMAEGLGTACTRADERMAASIGLIRSAATRFERCLDVSMGGVLAGLPALCGNGLLGGLGRHLSLPNGFYGALHVLMLLGFMALARIRRPEGLRHVPPGELGKVVGLDRAPEVRTLRQKISAMAESGAPREWMKELSATWMEEDPAEAGYLYVDGHVRTYSGDAALLPMRYVSRQKLCLRGTTDYWVNDALGRPFFVVSKTINEGMEAVLLNEIVPDLLASVPAQPSEEELAANPDLHRFVVVFDREGATHSLLSKLWEKRIAAITYRKRVKDSWPQSQFEPVDVPVPGGGQTKMQLASSKTVLSSSKDSMPVLEVRRMTETGHQTAIITTALTLSSPVVAGRMFSRWCQENFFAYMMQHYDIDGLVQYGSEEIPGTSLVVNPVRRELEKQIAQKVREVRKQQAQLGRTSLRNDADDIQWRSDLLDTVQKLQADLDELRAKRAAAPKKVEIQTLPEDQRPRQLAPLNKVLTDAVKMIAYRAETALVGLLIPHLKKEEEARALIRELFVSSADLEPDEKAKTLTVRIHRMACPAHDKAIAALLEELTLANFVHPGTGMRILYQLA
jgi:hypothetical protein